MMIQTAADSATWLAEQQRVLVTLITVSLAVLSSLGAVAIFVWKVGFRVGGRDTELMALEKRVAEMDSKIDAKLELLRAEMKAQTDSWVGFQAHRITDLDARYQRVELCGVLQQSMNEKIAMLPTILMGSDAFKVLIQREVSAALSRKDSKL